MRVFSIEDNSKIKVSNDIVHDEQTKFQPLDTTETQIQQKKSLEGAFTPYLMVTIIIAVFGSAYQLGLAITLFNTSEGVIKDFYRQVSISRVNTTISDYQLTNLWALTNGILPLGGICGAILSGSIADKFGRKRGLMLVNILVILVGIINSTGLYINSYEAIIVARFIAGIYCGLFTGILPIYLNEIAPMNLRGFIGTINQFFVVFGFLSSNIFGLPQFFGHADLWPLLVGFCLVPAVVNFLLITVEESPKFLFQIKNDKNSAKKALMKFRGESNEEYVANELISYQDELLNSKVVKWFDFCRFKHLRRPIIVAIVIHMSMMLSGINAVMVYSTGIFKSAGIEEDMAIYYSICLNIVDLIMTFVCCVLIDKAGRRILLLIGLIGMCISSIGLACFITLVDKFPNISVLGKITVIFAVTFVISFAIGPGPIPWCITSELFDSSARGKANSISCFVNWTCNALVTYSFKYIQLYLGSYSFLVYGCLLVFFSLFVIFFVPETKNKSDDDIKQLFKERHIFFVKKYF